MNVTHPRTAMNRKHGLAGVGLVLAVTLAACSGAGAAATSTTASEAAGGATSSSTTTSTSASSSSAPATGAAATKVNANSATVEQLQAAFEAAGIPNADRWAREVAEYRPYAVRPDLGAAPPGARQVQHRPGGARADHRLLEV